MSRLQRKVRDLELLVHGNGKMGLAVRIAILWHSWVWILMALSFVVGSVTNQLIGVWFD